MMKKILKLMGFSVLLGVSIVAYSASFDCQKARSINEKLICQDADLSKLDDEFGVAYKRALQNSDNPKELIANGRIAWQLREKECSSKSCLVQWFTQRTKIYSEADSTVPKKRKRGLRV